MDRERVGGMMSHHDSICKKVTVAGETPLRDSRPVMILLGRKNFPLEKGEKSKCRGEEERNREEKVKFSL